VSAPQAHEPDPIRPRLSVVVPAYGEVGRIARTVAALRETLGTDTEIIVVDDGSADGTSAAAEAAGAEQVIRFPVNRGKGAAVRAGMLAATGAVIVFTDADLSYSPAQVERVRAELERGTDVVVGSRRHVGTRTLVRARRTRELSGRVFNLFTRLVLPRTFGDTQCGLKGFRHDAARQIFGQSRIDRFAFDVEILWLAGHYGLSIAEVPVELDNAAGSTVSLSRDALLMLRDLIRIRRWSAAGVYGPRAEAGSTGS
jgi:glycosyltransferase involved in cell wall biosynthesis